MRASLDVIHRLTNGADSYVGSIDELLADGGEMGIHLTGEAGCKSRYRKNPALRHRTRTD